MILVVLFNLFVVIVIWVLFICLFVVFDNVSYGIVILDIGIFWFSFLVLVFVCFLIFFKIVFILFLGIIFLILMV